MRIKMVTGALALSMVVCLGAVSSSAASSISDSLEESVSTVDESSETSAVSEISATDVSAETSDTDEDLEEGKKKVSVKATGDVLIDADGFNAEITDKYTDEFGYSWTVHCENNTGDTVYFWMENVSVNGVMAVPNFGVEVEQGTSADADAVWYMDLKEFGIETPVVIEGNLVVADKSSYSILSTALFTVCPDGEDAAYYVTRNAAEGDITLLDNDYVNFAGVSFAQNEFDEADMKVYLTNKTDKDIILSIDGCFINDGEADPFWAAFLPAGKSVYTDIYWPLADLQAVGIDSFDNINKIVAEISVYDQESYEVYDNQIVTLNF